MDEKRCQSLFFRVAIPGKATGAHIHVGPGSTRLLSID
jgi:hypothetical protein